MAELQQLTLPTFRFENGNQLENLELAYHTFGSLNKAGDNVIWVFHALTANSNVLEWWPGLFGYDCLFNPEEHFIICGNVIGSPYGSSQPTDLNFPQFSMRDIVNAHYELALHLGIDKIKVAIGGSFGGNQALEFAYAFKGQIENLILIASCAKESAWSIAVHETQRMAMISDKSFGTLGGGSEGMAAARAIGMLTYRTSEAFIETQTDIEQDKTDDFRASSYIKYQGEKFIKRFNALAYYYLTKCLDTHNIGRERGQVDRALSKINIPTLVISFSSDMLIPTSLQTAMAKALPDCIHKELESEYGHDGFLVETKALTTVISDFLHSKKTKRAVLKFGGSSLKNGGPLKQALSIIKQAAEKHPIALVVSARGKTTNSILAAYELACEGKDVAVLIDELISYQQVPGLFPELDKYSQDLKEQLSAIATLAVDVPKAKDRILALGELMSAAVIAEILKSQQLKSLFVDARELIVTKQIGKRTEVNFIESRARTQKLFAKLGPEIIPVITGFIAIDEHGMTTTLGRNGSNYSASLIATFIGASEIQNWTDVDGVFSAHPKYVKNAIRIPQLNYREANELANFGASVLHSKTLIPLMGSNIPLKIYNSYNPNAPGTLINKYGSKKGVKAVSLVEKVTLVSIEGFGLSGKVGIDARIFSSLNRRDISVRLISQASSERGLGFVINLEDAVNAYEDLQEEFMNEINNEEISSIQVNNDIAIIAITGRHNYALEKAVEGLRKNKIWVYLFSNSISGENISLVIDNKQAIKALNVVHEFVIERL